MPPDKDTRERVRIRYDGRSSAVAQLVEMLRDQGFVVDREQSDTAEMERRAWSPTPEELHISIVVAKTAMKGAIGGVASLTAKNVAQRIVKRFNERNESFNAKAEIEDFEGDI